MAPDLDCAGLTEQFDTCLMGRRTFEVAGGGQSTAPDGNRQRDLRRESRRSCVTFPRERFPMVS